VAADVVADMEANEEHVPEPIALRLYLVTQSVLAADIMENLPNTQARSVSTDMCSIVICSSYSYWGVLSKYLLSGQDGYSNCDFSFRWSPKSW
jgi:hypothetical protein